MRYINGWKEIAKHLEKGIRTVQRYERELGLPVYRPRGRSSQTQVITTDRELDAWIQPGPARIVLEPRHRIAQDRANRLRADFLRINSEIALTFAGMALTANDGEKRKRMIECARKAYDTIVRLREDTHFREAEKEEEKLNANLGRLKSELQSLGQSF